HTLTGHVNVNDGSGAGYVNAPNGTMIIYSLSNSGGANGAFVGSSSCTTGNGTGSCPTGIRSTSAGTTAGAPGALANVGGVSLTRVTGDGLPGDSPNAIKTWVAAGSVRAQIAIAPSTTAEVGTSQSFTVTLSKDTGTGTFVPAAGEHVSVALTDSNG